MSRFELGGEGEPIPTIALPDPNLDEGFPIVTIPIAENGVFPKADYVNLGYTNYEVSCIGAAGGQGGGAIGEIQFNKVETTVGLSAANWTKWLEYTREQDFNPANVAWPPYTGYDFGYITGYSPDGIETAVEMEIRENPLHRIFQLIFQGAYLWSGGGKILGGAGGGGGLHIQSGLLADLPDETPVVVGQAGADGDNGQPYINGLATPMPNEIRTWPLTGYSPGSPGYKLTVLSNYFNPFFYVYALGSRTQIGVPSNGVDGGASSFGETLCRASGGKGGRAALSYPGGVRTLTGHGGDGGKGGQTTAGGGGLGSTNPTVAGSDGVWDGSIGSGGGGGSGGSPGVSWHGGFYQFESSPGESITVTLPARTASSGGRGSYSFADTSVYGQRQVKSGIIGGAGGGAKLQGVSYGGRAAGASPNGVVIIRLSKIDP